MRSGVAGLGLALTIATAVHAYSGDGYAVCKLDPNGDNFLALRTGPGSSNRMIMKLGPGDVVESRGDVQNGWLAVAVQQTGGRTVLRDQPNGYVYTGYLCRL
ncbi:hypothetical protein ROJ8625_01685 [Roseivivax jejudonensis]|uniref:Bacterial SH3 domain protein n=1 Tax=Roseivivax jejudonensis TaxID=1529041 RepID=A0A1X6Z0F1_9RHOB|nr:SH3 domain-containing protein [Roseivivax jejudonensis]SLN37096.1 hypothetical protein ROJ8625_01685 [Roseivivax jejudonensis]